jgi:hypothetical protein
LLSEDLVKESLFMATYMEIVGDSKLLQEVSNVAVDQNHCSRAAEAANLSMLEIRQRPTSIPWHILYPPGHPMHNNSES